MYHPAGFCATAGMAIAKAMDAAIRVLIACPPGRFRSTHWHHNFIVTCKPSSHKTIAEYLHGAELQEHRQTVCNRGKRTTGVYRWLSRVPLRVTDRCRHSQLVLHRDP